MLLARGRFYLKSRQNTPTSVVDEQVGDECNHISFHLVFFLFSRIFPKVSLMFVV